MILFRPVGLYEMEKILNLDGLEFPKRFANQPIFYPVTNIEYARQIAKEWNQNDESSGFAGYVTKFEVDDNYIEQFEVHQVGDTIHQEYWILAEELENFNLNIKRKIEIQEAYYGEGYFGIQPLGVTGFIEKNLKKQFDILKATLEYNYMDFSGTISVEWRIVSLNFLYWKSMINNIEDEAVLSKILISLERNNRKFIAL